MLYYKIKENCDNLQIWKTNNKPYYELKHFVIANELYTQTEKDKYNIPDSWCDTVNVNPKDTYFFFGARFALK